MRCKHILFFLFNRFDVLKIKQGNKLVRLTSGNRPNERDVVIEYSNIHGGEVDITFASDVTQTARGFHASYEIENEQVSTFSVA